MSNIGLKHIQHIEDLMLSKEADDKLIAITVLSTIIQSLKERKHLGVTLMTKYDGGFSLVFGHHPVKDRLFVASKSAFNKTPKMATDFHEIERMYFTNPGLQQKLMTAYAAVQGLNLKPGLFYQGDYLFDASTLTTNKRYVEFTPNVITYRAARNTSMAQQVALSYYGLYVHTRYTIEGPSSWRVDYTPDLRHDFAPDPRFFLKTQGWSWDHEWNLAPITAAWKHAKTNHSWLYAWAYNLKHAIIEVLNQRAEFETLINGVPSGPEGYVAVFNNVPYKLVNKNEFTAMNNLKWGRQTNINA